MRYTYQHDGQPYTLTLEGQPNGQFTVVLGERTFELQATPLPNGGWRVLVEGQAHTVYTVAQGDQRYVQVDDASYILSVPNTAHRRKATSGGDMLTAQMPGQVTAVLVQAGDTVTKGQTLLILEAMKMEIRVTAPAEGHLQQMMVQVGDVVARGQQLVAFEHTPA